MDLTYATRDVLNRTHMIPDDDHTQDIHDDLEQAVDHMLDDQTIRLSGTRRIDWNNWEQEWRDVLIVDGHATMEDLIRSDAFTQPLPGPAHDPQSRVVDAHTDMLVYHQDTDRLIHTVIIRSKTVQAGRVVSPQATLRDTIIKDALVGAHQDYLVQGTMSDGQDVRLAIHVDFHDTAILMHLQ